jgi:glutamate-1-semialdehyde 2,1-aminomutase
MDRSSGTSEERRYRSLTEASAKQFDISRDHLPGGDSRSTLFHRPHPLALAEGHGSRLVDVDGNQLLDLTGNHTALVHGYGHPAVLEAVRAQLEAGTCFPGPTPAQPRMAKLLRERIPSMDRVRFANSGTEAIMLAVRAARAHTNRPKLAKIEGGYHGTWDEMMISTRPPPRSSACPGRPATVPGSAGLPVRVGDDVVVLPFNDPATNDRIIEEHRDELAAVLVEPVLGSAGMIPAEHDYLTMLRELTTRHNILLIFDEVVSFRIAPGGAQQHYAITPDLTCLGKAVGGGFPLGVLGGRLDIMAAFDPSTPHGPRIPHPGSYNANPISLTAGAVTLELLTPTAIDRLNQLGQRTRALLRDHLAHADVASQVTGLGSLFAVHFTDRPVTSYPDAATADPEPRTRLYHRLFNHGVLIDPRGVGCLSTAIDEADLATLDAALNQW